MKISPIIVLMVPVLFTGCGSSSHNMTPITMPSNPINNRIHHGINHQDIGSPILFDHIKKKGSTKRDKKLKKELDKQPLCFLTDEKSCYPKDYKEEQDQIKQAKENSLETYKEEMYKRKKNDTLKKIHEESRR